MTEGVNVCMPNDSIRTYIVAMVYIIHALYTCCCTVNVYICISCTICNIYAHIYCVYDFRLSVDRHIP